MIQPIPADMQSCRPHCESGKILAVSVTLLSSLAFFYLNGKNWQLQLGAGPICDTKRHTGASVDGQN